MGKAPAADLHTEASVVTFHADYPAYDSLPDLEAQSSLVVEVKFTGESQTVLLTPEAPSDPSDPRQNPNLGVDPAVTSAQPETPPIVTTVHEARVTGVIDGAAKVGQLIEVQELGGTYQGVTYVPDDDTSINSTGAYLLFLTRDDLDQPFQLLNPVQAVYPEKVSGAPHALPANKIDVTTDELAEYVN